MWLLVLRSGKGPKVFPMSVLRYNLFTRMYWHRVSKLFLGYASRDCPNKMASRSNENKRPIASYFTAPSKRICRDEDILDKEGTPRWWSIQLQNTTQSQLIPGPAWNRSPAPAAGSTSRKMPQGTPSHHGCQYTIPLCWYYDSFYHCQ